MSDSCKENGSMASVRTTERDGAKMETLQQFLQMCAIIGNTWFLVSLSWRGRFSSAYLFLAHLTIADFIHDFHASLFTAISSWAEENYLDLVAPAMPLWLRANQFLGFSVSMVSLFAVVRALVEELICSCFKREDRRRDPETWIHFKTALNASHITLWCAAALLCFPILLFSVDLQQFGISVGGQEVLVAAPAFTSNSIQVLPHPDFLRPPSSPGIKSAIPSITESDSLLGAWAATLQCLLNPLWFPIACSCLLPVIAFLVLTRDFAVKSDCDGDRPNSLSEKCKLLEPNFRLLVGLLVIYYTIFIYDLLSVGDLDSDTFNYSHATRRTDDGDEAALELVYVCHHWTRAFGSVLRNVLVALCWHLDDGVERCRCALPTRRPCPQFSRAGMHTNTCQSVCEEREKKDSLLHV